MVLVDGDLDYDIKTRWLQKSYNIGKKEVENKKSVKDEIATLLYLLGTKLRIKIFRTKLKQPRSFKD